MSKNNWVYGAITAGMSVLASASFAADAQDNPDDFFVFFHTENTYGWGVSKTIDGGSAITRREDAREPYFCFDVYTDEDVKTNNIIIQSFSEILSAQLTELLKKPSDPSYVKPQPDLNRYPACAQLFRLVRRGNSGTVDAQANYSADTLFGVIRAADLIAVISRVKGRIDAQAMEYQKTLAQLQFDAAQDSKSSIYVLTLNSEYNAGEKNYSTLACTLNSHVTGALPEDVAVRSLYSLWLADIAKGSGQLNGPFDSVEAVYQSYQNSGKSVFGNACKIYIDTAKSINSLAAALRRDYPKQEFSVAAFGADEVTAKALGFDTVAQYKSAQAMGVNAYGAREFAKFDISGAEALNSALDEMIESKYSNSRNTDDLLQYLIDKRDGAVSSKTPLQVLNERKAQAERERAAAAKSASAKQAAIAKDFPYYAVLSCRTNNVVVSVISCFSGQVPTELELTNGTSYRLYQGYEVQSLGRQTNDGLVIDLRGAFKIKAQNAAKNLILGVKVVRRSNGAVLFERQAALFGVISVAN